MKTEYHKLCLVCNCKLFQHFDYQSIDEGLCAGCFNRMVDRYSKEKKGKEKPCIIKSEETNNPVTKVSLK